MNTNRNTLISEFLETIARNEGFTEPKILFKDERMKKGLISDVMKVELQSKNRSSINFAIKSSPELKVFRDQLLVRENYLNEIYFYGIIAQELQLNSTPSCYGFYKVPMQEIIILEDLKEFVTLKDPNDQVMFGVLDTFAEFHAAGFKLKRNKTKLYKKIEEECYGGLKEFYKVTKFTESVKEQCQKIEKLFEGDVLKKFRKFKENLGDVLDNYSKYNNEFATIIHGDAWVNNIMINYKGNKLMDIRLIDYQATRIGSPVQDIAYFFYTCCTKAQLEDLEKYQKYYQKKIENILGYDGYPLDILNQDWKKFATYALAMAIVVMHGMNSDPDEFPDIYQIAEKGGNVFIGLNYLSRNEAIYEEKVKIIIEHFANFDYI